MNQHWGLQRLYSVSSVVLLLIVILCISTALSVPLVIKSNEINNHIERLRNNDHSSKNIILHNGNPTSLNNNNQNNNNQQQHSIKNSDNIFYIVKFNRVIEKNQYQKLNEVLKELGDGYIHHYIPHNSFLIVSPTQNTNWMTMLKLEMNQHIESIHRLDSQLKISPSLGEVELAQVPVHGLRILLAKGYYQQFQYKLVNGAKLIDMENLVKESDAVAIIDLGNVDIDVKSLVEWISKQPQVYWVERFYPHAKPSNKFAHYSIQTGDMTNQNTPLWTAGVNGQGEIVGCADSGIDMNHCFFYDAAGNTPSSTHRKVVSYSTLATVGDTLDGHGTHVVGTVLGNPTLSSAPAAPYNGGSPNARVAFVDIGTGTADQLSVPSDPSTLFNTTYTSNARIHLDAWNTVGSGSYYTSVTAALDQFQNDNLDFLAIRSAGNSQLFQSTAGYTLSQESVSKNSLVVGSSNQDSATFVASIGYMDYDQILSTLQTRVCTNSDSIYGLKCSDFTGSGTQGICCNGNPVLAGLCCQASLTTSYGNATAYQQYQMTSFSSIGPTSDSRIKPDLLAPGAPIISSRSVPAAAADHCSSATFSSGTPSLVSMEGSSQAAAVAASAATLVRQYLREGYSTGSGAATPTAAIANPSASLIKATMINQAKYLGNVTSDLAFAQGYGIVDLSTILGGIDVANKTDAKINSNEWHQVCFQVMGTGVQKFQTTLVWTDPAGSPLSPLSLVNDLDLFVFQYINNNLRVFTWDDHVNNVESISINNAPPGRYDVRVFGTNVPSPDQTFSVVSTGNIKRIQCSECYYDPSTEQEQQCYIMNGIGIQSCQSDNTWSKCEIYACDSGYVVDKGITKSCVTMLSLTLYNIALLGAFGLIILGAVVFVLVFYKSKSLNESKYSKAGKGGKGTASSGNGGGNGGNGGAVELSSVGPAAVVDLNNNNNNGNEYGSGSTEDLQDSVHFTLIEIISLAKGESIYIIIGIILSFIDIALGLAIPLVSANIFDILYSGRPDEINSVILTFALIIIGMIIVQFCYGIMLALAGHKIIARLRREMFRRILMQDMGFFNERKTGELMSRLASDVSSVRNIISDSIPHMITQVATILGGMIMLFIISWKLTLVVLCPLPVLMVASHYYGNYIEVISMRVQDALADAATHAAETMFNIRTVRWFSAEEREVTKFTAFIQRSYQIALKMTIWNGIYNSTSGIFEQLSVFILLWYGATLVRDRDLTPSMLIAFNLFLPFISQSLTSIATLYTTYKSYKGSSYRFFEIMQRVPMINPTGGLTRERVHGTLGFHDVAFSYPGARDTPILKNVSLSFKPGTITALIGPSGGGKTTMLSLIGRLYDIDSGTIRLDGGDIRDWNISNLHDHISIVNQEPSLFSGTIAENVAYGKPTATRQQIMDACKQANAHDFITAMPNGYDTVIGERGASLSGGQKQRIAISRTILKNPTVLLLDEATSELDVESERLVQEAIDKLVLNRTVIIVAHRLSTILTADIIAVINDGGVSEVGTPEQLIEQKGMFYDFVQIQYGKHGGEIQITNNKTRSNEILRERAQTILQRVGREAGDVPIPHQQNNNNNLLDNDPSQMNINVVKRPPSPPLWRKGKKNTSTWTESKSPSLMLRQPVVQSNWHKASATDKLNKVIAKSRKKGFFNDKHGDVRSNLVNY